MHVFCFGRLMIANKLNFNHNLYELINTKVQEPDVVKRVVYTDELGLLIRECIAQSPQAQKKLYDRFSPMVYGIIKRYLYKDDTSAGEILNDAFLKIFTKLHQYSFQGAFEGWIRRIVINTLTDYLRKKLTDAKQVVEVQPETVFVNSEGLEKLSYKELLKLVQELPDMQRTVFNLFVFENFSHKEIADTLNMKENNCRWHLNDARKRLKEKLNHLTGQ